MKIILSGPANNSNCKAVAEGLVHADLLAKYYTSVAIFPGSIWDCLGNIKAFSEIKRKRFDPILKDYIKSAPSYEIARMLSNKFGFSNLTKGEDSLFCINKINLKHDKRVAASLLNSKKKGVEGVFCYEDVASFSFKESKRLGLKNLYELPIGYWRSARRLLEIETEKWPAWASTIPGFEDSDEKLMRKDEEIRLSDRIFVASSFTAKTLEEYPGKLPPVELVPYGFPPVIQKSVQDSNLKSNQKGPLKLLFVGSLSQRKGIANMFSAVEKVKNHVQLTVVGRKINDYCPALDAALTNHTWIPTLPNEKILELMRAHDVLLFPSLFEGFGLVITESMSQGTPVITTDRTAGKEFIIHGKNGWLVGRRDVIEQVSQEALITARNRPWEKYCQDIAEAVRKELLI